MDRRSDVHVGSEAMDGSDEAPESSISVSVSDVERTGDSQAVSEGAGAAAS